MTRQIALSLSFPMKRVLFIFLLLISAIALRAQTAYTLEIVPVKESDAFKKLSWKKTFVNKTEREKELRKVLLSLHENAYLAASFDSIAGDSLKMKAYLNIGDQYQWANLRKGNVDEGLLSEVGFREKIYRNKPLYYKDVKRVQDKLLTWCENNGYPFAAVKLDSIQTEGTKFSASLRLDKNPLIRIDSVLLRGSAKIAPAFLHSYIGIRPGSLYNESQVKKMGNRLKELPFVKESKPSLVLFSEKNTRLVLFLDKRRASQFDGILGILPDDKTGKILVTGDIHLKLQNVIGRGELLDLQWRSLQKNTQDLKTKFSYPFLFSTPFGIDYQLKLYKKDTSYLDVNQSFGIQYLLTGGNYIKAFINSKNSSLLSTKGIEFVTVLPPYADIHTLSYGLGFKAEELDYRLNPRKGYSFSITAAAGNKSIRKNARLNPIIYEGLTLNSVQYNAELEAALFIPVMNRSTIRIGSSSAYLYNNSVVFLNELFRIGGLRSLRGFDEESIFASGYSILSLEYRYLLEQNSYLYVFGDAAFYENHSINTNIDDMPYGFGTGISFETKAGIFSISYALGHQFSNPIQLRTGKVHFGIVSYF